MQTGPLDTLIALKAISLAEDLSGTEKRVGATLIDHYNRKTGQCDPALGSIARLLSVSRRTIIRAIGALVQKGYFLKTRHGGKYHRNSYQPVWSRFHANEKKWNESRAAARRFKAAEMSPLQGQECHPEGDSGGTQTSSNNPLEQNLPRASNQFRPSNKPIVCERLSKADDSRASYKPVRERFHVKPPRSAIAARDAAERRWSEQLTKQFVSAPDVFGCLIEAIDNDLRDVTTDVELKKPGAGIAFLMGELDRRSRLGFAQSSARRETNVFASDAKVAAETAAAKSDDRGKGGAAGEGGTISLEDSGADRRPRWP